MELNNGKTFRKEFVPFNCYAKTNILSLFFGGERERLYCDPEANLQKARKDAEGYVNSLPELILWDDLSSFKKSDIKDIKFSYEEIVLNTLYFD